MLSQDYTPKVNEERQVVGVLPGDVAYTLRPPTNRDLVLIESFANGYTYLDSKLKDDPELLKVVKMFDSKVIQQFLIFELLSSISLSTLLNLDAESVEVMAKALELFPVFRNKAG